MKLPRMPRSTAALNLIAFLATLLAITVLALAGRSDAAILTGLIGVLGSFRPWTQPDGANRSDGATPRDEEPRS